MEDLGTFADFYRNKGNTWSTKPDIAIVPGSFKPPHKGHYDMVKQYSDLAYNVHVLISAPSAKSQRTTSAGTVITPEMSKQIFDLYVQNLDNVTVEISDIPSPVGAAYAMIEALGTSPEPIPNSVGKKIALGASKKDGDWTRWSGAKEWAEKKGLNVEVYDPKLTAVDVSNKPDGTPYSASSIRSNISNPELFIDDIPEHVSPEQVINILSGV